jgi:rubredoxin-NAD+ reductase
MSQQPIIIVGSGLAGYTVAREFRKLDSETPVLIISADHGGFYSKPTLSNALATGKTPDAIVTAAEKWRNSSRQPFVFGIELQQSTSPLTR